MLLNGVQYDASYREKPKMAALLIGSDMIFFIKYLKHTLSNHLHVISDLFFLKQLILKPAHWPPMLFFQMLLYVMACNRTFERSLCLTNQLLTLFPQP